MGGPGYDQVNAVATDGAGNVYAIGNFRDTAQVGTAVLPSAGDVDLFFCKYDGQGNFQWARLIGGPQPDEGTSVTVDGSGNLYLSGFYDGTVDFDPGPGTHNITAVYGKEHFVARYDANGELDWARAISDSGRSDIQEVKVAASGDVYVSGWFYFRTDFDPGPGNATLTVVEDWDGYLCRLDPLGNLKWVRQFGGNDMVIATSSAVDQNGNVYLTGSFENWVDADPGPDSLILNAQSTQDAFVVKLDSAGELVWAKQIAGSGPVQPNEIVLDGAGNPCIGGWFYNTVDFDPGPGTLNLSSGGSNDAFFLKLDTEGDLIWARRIGDFANEGCSALTLDASDHLYATGFFSGYVDFDPGPGTYNLPETGQANFQNLYVLKLDPAGNFIGAGVMGGTAGEISTSIALDASGGVLVGGYFQDTVDFDPGPGLHHLVADGIYDGFVFKLNEVPTQSPAIVETGNLVLWPNPSPGHVRISTSEGLLLQSVTVRDLTGRICISERFPAVRTAALQIDGPAGLYLVELTATNGKTETIKLVKSSTGR